MGVIFQKAVGGGKYLPRRGVSDAVCGGGDEHLGDPPAVNRVDDRIGLVFPGDGAVGPVNDRPRFADV